MDVAWNYIIGIINCREGSGDWGNAIEAVNVQFHYYPFWDYRLSRSKHLGGGEVR